MPDSQNHGEEREQPVRALDPNEYTQNRRLQQIHNARDNVPEARREGFKYLNDRTSGGPAFRESDYRRYVASAVVNYGIEVEPVAYRSDTDVLHREVPETDMTIQEVLSVGGELDGGYLTLEQSRWIRRQFDRFLAEVGLGLDVEDDTEDKWEI